MAKKDLDWGNLGFNYMPCDYSYVCNYKDGAWEEGGLTEDHTLTLSEDAGIFHYCQEIFEGLKAYTTEEGLHDRGWLDCMFPSRPECPAHVRLR